MLSLRLSAALVLVSTALSAAPAPAGASVIEVIRDCRDGTIDGDYTARELRDAERNLPSDQVEYGDCADALRQAQLDARRRSTDSSGGGGGSGGGNAGGGRSGGEQGATPTGRGRRRATNGSRPTPNDDVQALTQEKVKVGSGGPPPEFTVGSGHVVPRAPAASSLPLPLALAMVASGLLGLAGAWHVTSRSLGERLVSLRLFRR